MAVLKIVQFGDPMLRKVARPVEEITPRIRMLLDDTTGVPERRSKASFHTATRGTSTIT